MASAFVSEALAFDFLDFHMARFFDLLVLLLLLLVLLLLLSAADRLRLLVLRVPPINGTLSCTNSNK